MSYSWVDPSFASLYARREERRAATRLQAERERRPGADVPGVVVRTEPVWLDPALAFGRLRVL